MAFCQAASSNDLESPGGRPSSVGDQNIQPIQEAIGFVHQAGRDIRICKITNQPEHLVPVSEEILGLPRKSCPRHGY